MAAVAGLHQRGSGLRSAGLGWSCSCSRRGQRLEGSGTRKPCWQVRALAQQEDGVPVHGQTRGGGSCRLPPGRRSRPRSCCVSTGLTRPGRGGRQAGGPRQGACGGPGLWPSSSPRESTGWRQARWAGSVEELQGRDPGASRGWVMSGRPRASDSNTRSARGDGREEGSGQSGSAA